MSDFFEVLDKPTTTKKFNKSIPDYIKLEPDRPIKVQFLLPPAVGEVHTHWVQGRKLPVRCLGMDCPICNRNKTIGYDNKHPDFIRRDESKICNVIDLTAVKICPHCEYVNERSATKCTNEECNKIIIDIDVQPLKVVRYLEGNKNLFTQIRTVISQTLSNMGLEQEDVQNLVFTITRTKIGDNNVHSVIPSINDKSAVDANEYRTNLFNYEETGIHVNYDEMVMLMSGASFKDVIARRNNKETNKKSELDDIFGKD